MPQQSKVAAVGILLPLLILCLITPGALHIHQSKKVDIRSIVSSYQVSTFLKQRKPVTSQLVPVQRLRVVFRVFSSLSCSCDTVPGIYLIPIPAQLVSLWTARDSCLSVCSVCVRMALPKHASVNLTICCCISSSCSTFTQVIIDLFFCTGNLQMACNSCMFQFQLKVTRLQIAS